MNTVVIEFDSLKTIYEFDCSFTTMRFQYPRYWNELVIIHNTIVLIESIERKLDVKLTVIYSKIVL